MTRIPSLGDAPHLADVFRTYIDGVPELLAYHDIVLRGPSPLSVAERELIAAYVSGLNGCDFCFGAHQIIAEAAGVDPAVFAALMDDIESAPVDQKLKPIFRYVQTLTRTPSKVTDAQTEEIRKAGWDDRAIHDAVRVCALFNFMNRLVEGMGIESSEAIQADQRQRSTEITKTQYTDFGRKMGLIE
jgi:uncharacterized peroxidase-related enzyme